ncbi:MAG TPA: ABC transporter permease [Phycisphaerae bacterium]|nr:ABC transporter permease [Phycisphaerae bacterium]HRW52406.1 ABC transporter permease [Phycisphaerae bacterium]
MQQLLALTAKDLRLLARDKVGFFFAFIFPILYSSLFGSIMGGIRSSTKGIDVVVVDEDRTKESEEFVVELEGLDEFRVDRADRKQAQDLVRLGKKRAMILLPEGFGQARRQMFGNPPRVEIGIDPSRIAETGILQGVLTAQLYKGVQRMFTDPEAMDAQVNASIREISDAKDMDAVTKMTMTTFLSALKTFMKNLPEKEMKGGGFPQPKIEQIDILREESHPTNSYQISFPQGCIWGIMGCAAGFGITLVVERTRGTLVRLCMAPIGKAQILAGKGLACLLTTLAVAGLLFTIAAIVFEVRPTSYALLAVAIFCIAICFVGIMMFLSVMGKTEQSAGGIGWAILVLMAMIGGGMIPLAFMPEWLQSISDISPVKWSILAMEGAVWRNFSPAEMFKPCAVLIGFGVVSFVIGLRAFKWET